MAALMPNWQTRWQLSVLAFCGFVRVTTEFSIVAVVPDLAAGMNVPLAQAGSLMGWFALSAAVLGPILTTALRSADPWRLLACSSCAFVAGNLAIVLFPNYLIALVIRLIQGSLLPVIIANVLVSAERLVPPTASAWAVARANTGIAAATVAGIPALNWISGSSGWQMAFVSLAAVGVVASVTIIALAPPPAVREVAPAGGVKRLIMDRGFLAHLLSTMIIFTGMFSGYTYLTPLLRNRFDGGATAMLLLAFGVAGLVGSWLIGYATCERYLSAMVAVSAALTVAMGAVGVLDTAHAGAMFLLFVGWGMAHTMMFTVVLSRALGLGRACGRSAIALNLSACNVGIATGSWLGGWAVASKGVEGGLLLGAVTVLIGVTVVLLPRLGLRTYPWWIRS